MQFLEDAVQTVVYYFENTSICDQRSQDKALAGFESPCFLVNKLNILSSQYGEKLSNIMLGFFRMTMYTTLLKKKNYKIALLSADVS